MIIKAYLGTKCYTHNTINTSGSYLTSFKKSTFQKYDKKYENGERTHEYNISYILKVCKKNWENFLMYIF